jgi:hypothetical protein
MRHACIRVAHQLQCPDENTLVLFRKNHLDPTHVRPLSEIKIHGDLITALITPYRQAASIAQFGPGIDLLVDPWTMGTRYKKRPAEFRRGHGKRAIV